MVATSCVLLNVSSIGDELRTNDALTELAVTGFDDFVLNVTNNERATCVEGSKVISCTSVSFFFEIAVCVKCAMELSLEAAYAPSLVVDIFRVVIKEWLLVMLKDHELISGF